MKIRAKKVYLITVPIFLIAGFLYGGSAAQKMRESEIYFQVLQNEQYRFWILGALNSYLWAARASGFLLILDFEGAADGKSTYKGLVSRLILAVFGNVFVGVPTLIPCYIINLADFVKERKSGKYPVQHNNIKSKYVIIVLLIVFLVALTTAGGRRILAGRDIGKMKVSQAAIWNEIVRKEENAKTEVIFYDTVQNAVNTFWRENGPQKLEFPSADNEIFRCGDGNQCFCVWIGETVKEVPCLIGFCFNVKGDLYSYPEYVFWQQIDGMERQLGAYDDRQRVVRDIVASYRHGQETQKANGNIPVYYGICQDDDAKNLSVMRQRPDEVKEFEYKGKQYYFWYYMDGTFIQKRLEEMEAFQDISMDEAEEYLKINMAEMNFHEGVKREFAIEKCMENQNYYMVKFSEANTGLTYIISEGEDTGVEVELQGNTPLNYLSSVFRDGRNEFLVYGYEMNAEQKTTNVSTLEDIVNPYTIVVEKWEIITPIYRDYTYSSHERMFYPKGYIDSYDLEHGDYKIIDTIIMEK